MTAGAVRKVKQRLTGPMLLAICVVFLEGLAHTPWHIANPAPLLLLVIAYAAFVDPPWKAWASTVVVVGYSFVYHSAPGALFTYQGESLQRLLTVVVVAPIMAWMTTSLTQRAVALEREASRRRVAEHERDFMRLVLARAPVPVLVTRGEEHEVVLANREAAHLLDAPVERIERRPLSALARADAALWRALDSALREGVGTTLRAVSLHRHKGTARTIQVSLAPLPGDDGAASGVLVMAVDLTEQKKAEADLATLRAELSRAERLAAMGAMVSGLTHELRTPLTYIANHLYILRPRVADPEQAAHVDEALAGVERIKTLAADLRRYLRTEGGPPRLLQLEKEVGDALRLFEGASRGNVAIERDLQPARAIFAEPLHVQQITLNLVDNAAAFTPPGGRVRVRVADEGAAVALVVMDEGPGMSQQVRARIFDPLFTTKEDGTGLGLAIVRRLVESHGGTIVVESEPGKGSTFRVLFPVPRAIPVEEPPEGPHAIVPS